MTKRINSILEAKGYRNYFLLIAAVFTLALVQESYAIGEWSPERGLAAEDSFNECPGIDIVFVVDQSESMGGEISGLPNDKDGRRISSVEFAIQWLASNNLARCPDVAYQVAVVSFGTEAVIDLSPTIINPANYNDWKEVQSRIEEQIEPTNLGHTDPKRAFTLVKSLFEEFEVFDGAARKRVIVLLTDGAPFISDDEEFDAFQYMRELNQQISDNFDFSPVLLAREQALDDLEDFYSGYENIPRDEINRIPIDYPIADADIAESTYIWVVAMNDYEDYLATIGAQFQEIASTHGGQLIDLPNNLNEVPITFTRILSRLSGLTYTRGSCGIYAVKPYLSGLRIEAFTSADEIEVNVHYLGENNNPIYSISGDQGDVEELGLVDYKNFGVIETLEFRTPPAGRWQIEATDCRGLDITVSEIEAKLSQEPPSTVPQQPNGVHPAERNFGVEIQLEGLDPQNNPITLENNPDYPLVVAGQVEGPNGFSGDLLFSYSDEELAWTSDTSVPSPAPGNYHYSILVTAPCVEVRSEDIPHDCPEGDGFTVFEYSDGVYSVSPVTMLEVAISDPVVGSEIPTKHFDGIRPPKISSIPIVVTFSDPENNTPVAITDALKETSNIFPSAVLNFRGVDYPVLWKGIDPGDPSRYLGEVQIRDAEQGTASLTIALDEAFQEKINYEQYALANSSDLSTTFARRDTLLSPQNIYFALVTTISILLLIAIWLFLDNARKAVKGRILFSAVEGSLRKSINIGRSRKRVVIRKDSVFTKTNIKQMVVTNAPPRGDKQVIDVVITTVEGTKENHSLVDGGQARNLRASKYTIQYQWGGRPKQQKKDGRSGRTGGRGGSGARRSSRRGRRFQGRGGRSSR